MKYTEAVALRRSVKKSALGNSAKFTGKHLCWTIYFNEVTGLQVLRKETPTQVLSRGFCKIVMNIFIYRTPLVAASEYNQKCSLKYLNFSVHVCFVLKFLRKFSN